MSKYFYAEEQRSIQRIEVLSGLLSDTEIPTERCPLFYTQITRMKVLTAALSAEIHELLDKEPSDY